MQKYMTIKDLLSGAVDERGDSVFLRFKSEGAWQSYTFKQLQERAWHVTEMCRKAGVKPGDKVGLYRENAPEWMEIYLGVVSCGAVVVPIDAQLRQQEVFHILHDSTVSLLFTAAKHYAVFSEIEDRLPNLKQVVMVSGNALKPLTQTRVYYKDYQEFFDEVDEEARSEKRAFDKYDPDPEDTASLIYTSGTTGRQKGTVLSHRNFVSNASASMESIDISHADNFLLVLPLHHSFAFTTTFLLPLLAQCEVSMVENLRTIKENMAESKPTVMTVVPLLLEKMIHRIIKGLKKKKLAYWIYRSGGAKLIGKGINKQLGGRLRLIVSGGAPCDPEILGLWNKFGIGVVEGYGITETAPVLTLNPIDKPKPGTVGLPLPNVQIRIAEADKMGVGEICVKGPNVMQGYFNNPEATAKVLRDGWFYSGDIGFFDEDGYLTINGRKKSLIVNREGKNIYPEEVEQEINKSPYILECIVLGYREPSDAVGERIGIIVVPDSEETEVLESKQKKFSDEDLIKLATSEVKRLSRNLGSYKRPRNIQVRFEEFEKTSTAKIKRYLYAIDTSHM